MEFLKGNRNSLFFGVFLILALLGLSISGFYNQDKAQKTETSKTTEKPTTNSEIVVFGTWTSEGSKIKGIDINSGKEYVIANLPTNIKKITILSPNEILFVGNVDKKDHGKELSIYDISSDTTKVISYTSDNFGIDDYVISPNKRFVATWEVEFENSLNQGKSRVYSIDLEQPNVKNLVYDETTNSTTTMHYPVAITNSGEIYLDTFLANTEAGWGYGMSVSNFMGTQKQELSNMRESTYGTQPVISPNGQKLIFAGYDGAFGSGNIRTKSGFRQAILKSNTVETLDINTKQRQKLQGLSNQNIYSSASWNSINSNPVITVISKNNANTGFFEYSLNQKKLNKISVGDFSIISNLKDGKILAGKIDQSSSTLGNLGERYASPFTSFYILDKDNPKGTIVPSSDGLMQFITVLPPLYFSSSQTSFNAIEEKKDSSTSDSKKTLQLVSIMFKPELAPIRIEQQSKPKCMDLSREQCLATGITDTKELEDCARTNLRSVKMQGNCYDSPLYLYGEKGLDVKVEVQTPTYPKETQKFNAILEENGSFLIKNKKYDSLSFSYRASIKSGIPENGKIVSKKELLSTLREFGQKLALNEKESSYLMSLDKKILSPFVFVSFFNHQTSNEILPIKFNPKPDNYRNIVFYFKQLSKNPNINIDPPVFEPIKRGGFTAVEISEIVE